jgi:hypothetical protein
MVGVEDTEAVVGGQEEDVVGGVVGGSKTLVALCMV